jgi:hypothetical protein
VADVVEPVDLGAAAARPLEELVPVESLDHLLEASEPPIDVAPALCQEIGRQVEIVDPVSPLSLESLHELTDHPAELVRQLVLAYR